MMQDQKYWLVCLCKDLYIHKNGMAGGGHFSFSMSVQNKLFVGFAYQGKDIVFRFITEYSSLRDFGP
jgi:hypothetical protein